MAKHSTSPPGRRANEGDRSWLRHFWTALALLILIAIGAVFLQANQKPAKPQKLDAYVPLTIRTMVGNRQYVKGTVSLLIDSTQETGVLGRQKQLETIVTASIVRLYSAAMRPSLMTVRDHLLESVNDSLPKRLQVKDVLIQDLIIGTG